MEILVHLQLYRLFQWSNAVFLNTFNLQWANDNSSSTVIDCKRSGDI